MPGLHDDEASAGGATAPKKKCTVCNDFSSFAKQQKKKSNRNAAGAVSDATGGSGQAVSGITTPSEKEKAQCPADRMKLGKHTWTLLHTMSVYYPDKPSSEDKKEMKGFIGGLARHYPCTDCASHLQKYMVKKPPSVESREEVSLWMCNMHNEVNKFLGKDQFDCSKVLERWRDGWKDGSCD
eukprot:CFRG5888T1